MSVGYVVRAAAALLSLLVAMVGPVHAGPRASAAIVDWCPRPLPGAVVLQPRDMESRDGVLNVDLRVRSYRGPDKSVRYCYLSDGAASPTLRLHPGDLLVLRLKNELTDLNSAPAAMPGMTMTPAGRSHASGADQPSNIDPCNSGVMSGVSTNLHFHGLTVPARCHEDEVLKTSIQPGDPPFEYRFRIPENEPPGLYWYHPHIHGFSSRQVLGGASGALIVEGIERAVPQVAGLPQRVLVIRDQDLMNPNAPPSKSEPVLPRTLIDRDGDSANTGTGFGRPAKDLSINFVPVPWPDYPPARIQMKPGAHELWRVLNASAITYLNLALIFGRAPQQLGLVGIDGVPMDLSGHTQPVTWVDHIGVPPGARVEFIVNGPGQGVPAMFVTRTVDTGQGGENDPNRALANIIAAPDAAEPHSLPASSTPLTPTPLWLGDIQPVRVRKLYFSEKLDDPNDANSATTFFITVDGQSPKARYRGAAGRRGGLGHRESLHRTACLPHPPAALHVGGVERRRGQRAFFARYGQCPLLQWTHAAVSERAGTHGLPRSRLRRHFRLSLSPAGARGCRHDGHHPGRSAPERCRGAAVTGRRNVN
jgi:FtsP/CotA-like multicopper oxidase with cupredoxin domain